ncbi:MAG: WYL domain-containing protein [Chloroflexi bacterium]|nr:WYL domain-containing protein [Chloroflexota bacterium]
MNRWALMLQQSPPELQRLIARVQRVSLPRGCDAAERLRRLRRALCSAAAVRSTYATLDDDTHAALDALRRRRGGIDVNELVRQYGPIRSLRQLARDPRPQSIAERLLVLGWLLPRPATPHHPPRYVLPPELRRALPLPLAVATAGTAPDAPLAPALRAAISLLLVCAATPLAVRADGMLRRSALRALMPLFPAHEADIIADLYAFVLPLLRQLGLVVCYHGRCTITPGAAPFLALPHSEQRERLTNAWIASPDPDRWLRRLRLALRGIDWPLLRRRLITWTNAVPAGQFVVPETLYDTLAASFGPLADAQTHGFRTIRRTPWQPQNAAQAFHTALREPLAWLGIVAWYHQYVYRPAAYAGVDAGWRYEAAGEVFIPFAAADAALQLAPHGCWVRGDHDGLTFRVTPRLTHSAKPASLQQSTLHQLLSRYAGPPPAGWSKLLEDQRPSLQVFDGVLLLAETPDDLARALRARSVRRYVRARPAPGIALTRRAEQVLVYRALARQGVMVAGDPPEPTNPATPPDALSPGDCAALVMACAFYRRYAPGGMPLTVDDQLETRLRVTLPPPLRAAVDEALARLDHVPLNLPGASRRFPTILEDHATDAAPAAPHSPDNHPIANDVSAHAVYLRTLRRALDQRNPVTIDYDTGGTGSTERRTIRPLELEQRGDAWYVRAYCLRRQAERTFRVDRIQGIV